MSELESVKSENETLKAILEQVRAQNQSASTTVSEILQANLNLKANNILLENRISKLNADMAVKDDTIKKLTPSEPDLAA